MTYWGFRIPWSEFLPEFNEKEEARALREV